jgi:hypothetical protein
MIKKGPMTMILVFSNACPHCHTYMPIWDKISKAHGRKANMVSMEASTYQQTPMSGMKEVSGVPTVLFVDKEGRISEAKAARDERVMTNAVRIATPVASSEIERVASSSEIERVASASVSVPSVPSAPSAPSASLPIMAMRKATPYPSKPMAMTSSEPRAMTPSEPRAVTFSEPRAVTPSEPRAVTPSEPRAVTDDQVMESLTEEVARAAAANRKASVRPYPSSNFRSVVPGTVVSENPLPSIPGYSMTNTNYSMRGGQGGGYNGNQRGGNPWSAFLLAASQAAPAAALLGAYTMLPKRSSGLAAPSGLATPSGRRKTRRA